jgi:hypothetical protein
MISLWLSVFVLNWMLIIYNTMTRRHKVKNINTQKYRMNDCELSIKNCEFILVLDGWIHVIG